MKCIVIDDDKKAVDQINSYIEQTDSLDVAAAFSCPKDACSLIREGDIDLIFIEIDLTCMSGFDFLKSLPNPPHMIIVTKNSSHAVTAFFYNIIDFLLKPVDDYSRFLRAIKKVKETDNKVNSNANDHFYIKVDSLMVRLDFNEINWLQAFGDFVKIVTPAKTYITKSTLKFMEEKLPFSFVRVHRSYIINLNKIKNIDNHGHNLQIEGKIIPISFRRQKNLRQKINLV